MSLTPEKPDSANDRLGSTYLSTPVSAPVSVCTACLVEAVVNSQAFVALSGRHETDRTAVLKRASQILTIRGVRVIHVHASPTGEQSLSELIDQLVEQAPPSGQGDEELERAFQALTIPGTGYDRIALLVENTHTLSVPALRYIKSASIETAQLRIVMAGPPGFQSVIGAAEFDKLASRLTCQLEVLPSDYVPTPGKTVRSQAAAIKPAELADADTLIGGQGKAVEQEVTLPGPSTVVGKVKGASSNAGSRRPVAWVLSGIGVTVVLLLAGLQFQPDTSRRLSTWLAGPRSRQDVRAIEKLQSNAIAASTDSPIAVAHSAQTQRDNLQPQLSQTLAAAADAAPVATVPVTPVTPVTAVTDTSANVSNFAFAVAPNFYAAADAAAAAAATQEAAAKPVAPNMVLLRGGTFSMGSGEDASEQPMHTVTIAPFLIAKYATTIREWQPCVTAKVCSPVAKGGPDDPVTNVSWDEVSKFVAWLSKSSSEPYRLLTEAEWEYAARANTRSRFWWGNAVLKDKMGCKDCGAEPVSLEKLPQVATFPSNPFGIFGMGGGVGEWVADCWHNNYSSAPANGSTVWDAPNCHQRVLRGGSWISAASESRPSSREYYNAGIRYPTHGFRLGRSVN